MAHTVTKVKYIQDFIEKFKNSVVLFDYVRNNIDINYHVSYDGCAICEKTAVGDKEYERYPAISDYSWSAALNFAYAYCKHLTVYKYRKHEVDIFIKTIVANKFLKNNAVDGWCYTVEPWTEVLQLKFTK